MSDEMSIEEMRERVTVSDNKTCEREGITPAMMRALGSLPVTLVHGNLPRFAPSGATLRALESRGLAERSWGGWVRTTLGESMWERR